MKPKPRNQYSKRLKTSIKFKQPSRTKQAFKEQCDINTIMTRFATTGILPETNSAPPVYGDAPSQTFHESMNAIHEAKNDFYDLPNETREKFDFNPHKYIDFITNNPDASQLADMGLLSPEGYETIHAEQKAARAASDALASQNTSEAPPNSENTTEAQLLT